MLDLSINEKDVGLRKDYISGKRPESFFETELPSCKYLCRNVFLFVCLLNAFKDTSMISDDTKTICLNIQWHQVFLRVKGSWAYQYNVRKQRNFEWHLVITKNSGQCGGVTTSWYVFVTKYVIEFVTALKQRVPRRGYSEKTDWATVLFSYGHAQYLYCLRWKLTSHRYSKLCAVNQDDFIPLCVHVLSIPFKGDKAHTFKKFKLLKMKHISANKYSSVAKENCFSVTFTKWMKPVCFLELQQGLSLQSLPVCSIITVGRAWAILFIKCD